MADSFTGFIRKLLAVIKLLSLASGYDVKTPSISLLVPQGLRISYPDEAGISRVSIHYTVDQVVAGTQPAVWNIDINQATGGEWLHANREVDLQTGNTLYFWVEVVYKGDTYRLTDQQWRVPDEEKLVFEDNFDTLDFSKWQHEITAGGGGNWEFEYYTNNRSNSYVRDGILFIKPTLTVDKYGENFLSSGTLDLWGSTPADQCTGNAYWGCFRQGTPQNFINPIQSARLRSRSSFSLSKPGRLEVEAKMPKGDWIWPAIWMLPKYNEYGDWPASGEVDLVESRGNANLTDAYGNQLGYGHVTATLHWGPFPAANRYYMTTASRNLPSADDYHKYAVEWGPNSTKFFMDDEEILAVDPGDGGFWDWGGFNNLPGLDNPWHNGGKMAPFNKEFYIILNVAVGGTNGFFSDDWKNGNGAKPWSNQSPTAAKEFWQGRQQWYPTWNPGQNNGEDAALKVKSVCVWQKS